MFKDSPGWQESYAGVPSVKNPDFDFFTQTSGTLLPSRSIK